MYLTTKMQLRGLSVSEYAALRSMCRLTKNLYNEGLYSVRQYYFLERKYLCYEGNYHACKGSENYALLNTDIAQQTLKVVDRSFKSFFALIKKSRNGGYQFSQIRIPHYLPKEGFFPLIIPRIKVKDGAFTIPTTKAFRESYGSIRVTVPPQLLGQKIQEVRIHPKQNARFFEAEYVYEKKEFLHDLDDTKYLGIDLGLDNLATCVTNDGASFILDGKQLKSYNRLYNKENARLQSIKDLQGGKNRVTRRQYLNLRKRNRRINHGMSVAASRIIRYCVENRIGTVVCGYNPEWKRDINIGKRNNQNFVQIPHRALRNKLSYLCLLHGIRFVEQEESYTSKASFFDNDPIPVLNLDNPQEYEFSGKRISRGRYRCSNGRILNADLNGALNILQKCNLVSLTTLQTSGCVSQPERIRLF